MRWTVVLLLCCATTCCGLANNLTNSSDYESIDVMQWAGHKVGHAENYPMGGIYFDSLHIAYAAKELCEADPGVVLFRVFVQFWMWPEMAVFGTIGLGTGIGIISIDITGDLLTLPYTIYHTIKE